jgi:hypothetical protein
VAREACEKKDFQSARSFAVEALRLACASEPGQPHHARGMAYMTLALVDSRAGDAAQAGVAMASAAAEARALEPSDFENAAVLLEAVARFELEHGRRGEARRLGQELVEWHARHLGDDHPRYFARRFEWLASS